MVENDRVAYLDGLRGWAAVVVLLYHSYCDDYPAFGVAHNVLPRTIFFNGTMAVQLFFVVSGFSVALPYLRSGRRNSIVKIAAGRYFRLAIPIFAACVITHLMMMSGVIRAPVDRIPFDRFLNFDLTWAHLFQFSLFDVFFRYTHAQSYIPPLWTMSVELLGSLVVLAAQFVLGRSRLRWIIYLVMLAGFAIVGSYNVLFVLGLCLADIGHTFRRPAIEDRLGWLLFAVGACLPLLSRDFQVTAVATALVFLGVATTGPLRAFMSSPFSAFLGRLSFPLYLMHATIMYAIGVPLVIAADGQPLRILLGATAVLPIAVLAGLAFMPINDFAVVIARRFGRLVAFERAKPGTQLMAPPGA